jgi:hypothetical protein
MKQLHIAPVHGECVLEDDHSQSSEVRVTIDFVKQRPDGTWYIWNRGNLSRDCLEATDRYVEVTA